MLTGSVELANLDGDGSLDLLQARGILDNSNGAFFVPNLSNGDSWDARREIYYEITQPVAFAVTDWNSDGKQDILWTDFGSGKLSWLENLDGQEDFAPNEVLFELPGGGTDLHLIPQEQNDEDGLVLSISQDGAPRTFLLAVLNRNSATPDDFQPLDVIDTLQRRELNTGDLDGDGDIDILAYHQEFGLSWFEKTAAGYTLHPLANADIRTSYSSQPGLGDLDGDGHPDVMGYVGEQLTWFLNPDGEGPSAQHTLVVPIPNFASAEAADLNGDGRMEIVGPYFDIPSQTTYATVVRYQPVNNAFGPLEFQHAVRFGNYNIMDVNNDGYPDYCSLEGTFLNLGGTGTFAPAVQPDLNLTVATPGDLDGDGVNELIAARYSLYWVEATPFFRPALTGRVVLDTMGTCSYEDSAPGIPNWLVRTEDADGEETIVSTQLDGRYALSLPDTGAYQVEVVPPFSYWEMCPPDTTLLFPDVESRDSALFTARALSDCPLVTVAVYASRLRPCIPGFITVSYLNNGTLPAYDVPIEVVLDSALLVTGTDLPWEMMTDSSLIFIIPELGLFESGRIVLDVEPDCNLVTVGDLICTTVQTEPDTSCLPPSPRWDGSTLEARGFCQGDTTYFELRNVGDSPMSEARPYRIEIVNDDIVVFLIDDVQLNPGEWLPITIPNDSLAFRLVAEQDPNHPLAEDVSLVVAGCGFPDSLLGGVVEQFPYSTGNPFRQTFCREVTSSFDPNIKTALPRGIGEDHLIDDHWRLNYVIDFQNTGNDTAFTVVIRDTLSEHLDLSSLRIQGGSDLFRWALNPGRELVFTFENILLPDSTTNFEGSLGHISFQVKPRDGLVPGTVIENTAAIYFDFNAPIITNTTFHTIRKPRVYASASATLCPESTYLGQNWGADTLVQELVDFIEYDSLTLHDIEVLPSIITYVDTALFQGTVLAGVLLEMDTVFTDTISVPDACDEYLVYQVTVISSTEEQMVEMPGLRVFPNPAREQMMADWSQSMLAPDELQLFNSAGQLVRQYPLPDKQARLELQLGKLPPGLYLLVFTGEFGKAHRRLVVY
jgi:hypothetical protein